MKSTWVNAFRSTLVTGAILGMAAQASAASLTTNRNTANDAPAASTTRVGVSLMTYGARDIGVSGASFTGATTPTGSIVPALGTWIEFNHIHSLQGIVGIAGTSPFQFGAGAVYRARVLGGRDAGLHVGAGFNMGTKGPAIDSTNKFYTNIFGVGGVTVGFGGPNHPLQLSFDAGPVFAATPDFNFTFRPLSDYLGVGLTYFI